MSNIIIYDFEVFKYDTLLGAIIINDDKYSILQTWDLDEIRNFYKDNIKSIWIGHNNSSYDNFILEAIIKKKNPYIISQELIHSTNRFQKLTIDLIYYDIIKFHFGSLKAIEAAEGKKISESEISFEINRPLTDEEKIEVESYNLDDLDQTYDNFINTFSEFSSRIELINTFNLSFDTLHITESQAAEKVLHAKKIENIENMNIQPKLYENLRIKNKQVIDFYLSEDFKKGKNLQVDICGLSNKLGAGGIHGAVKKGNWDWALYCDVSGYYNLVMILYDLLPRTIPDKYKKIYEELYHYQLTLKKVDPIKRSAIKIVLLAVFGSMTNEYTKFYDPNKGKLVTIVGQVFLVDLLEKLEGKIELIQTNTDGIIVKPLNGISVECIKQITNEWQQRTGFTLKFDKIYNLYQRDVNNYFFVKENGDIHRKGEICTYYNRWDNPLEVNSFLAKESMVIYHGVIDFFIYKKLPEQVIEENKNKLRMFQYICKKGTYDYCLYEITNLETNEITQEKVQNINRAFASNSELELGMLYKVKPNSKAKISNLPDNIFVYNEEILSNEAVNKLMSKINYSYYIKRCYERISEFIDIPYIKDLNI